MGAEFHFDTSVLNFAVATDVPEERQATLQLLKEIKAGIHEVFISDIVLRGVNGY